MPLTQKTRNIPYSLLAFDPSDISSSTHIIWLIIWCFGMLG